MECVKARKGNEMKFISEALHTGEDVCLVMASMPILDEKGLALITIFASVQVWHALIFSCTNYVILVAQNPARLMPFMYV